MNDNTFNVVLTVMLIIASFCILLGVIANNPPFPKAMRLQNDRLIEASPDDLARCHWGYVAPGYGVHLVGDDKFVIDKKFTGALLTVNIDKPGTIRLVGIGSDVDHPNEFITIGHGMSAVWPIQAVHQFYYIEVLLDHGYGIEMCRVSLQINR